MDLFHALSFEDIREQERQLLENNCHNPAGPGGGQFCSGSGTGDHSYGGKHWPPGLPKPYPMEAINRAFIDRKLAARQQTAATQPSQSAGVRWAKVLRDTRREARAARVVWHTNDAMKRARGADRVLSLRKRFDVAAPSLKRKKATSFLGTLFRRGEYKGPKR